MSETGGTSDYVSFTNEGGLAGMIGFRLADQRPRYGHRGSGLGVCGSAASPSAATPKDFG